MRQLLIAVLAVMLYGCAHSPSYASRAMQLELGMTKDAVLSVMGKPKKVAAHKDGSQTVERYSWWSPKAVGFASVDNELLSQDRVFVKFADGKAVEWGDSYDFGSNLDRSMQMQRDLIDGFQQKPPK